MRLSHREFAVARRAQRARTRQRVVYAACIAGLSIALCVELAFAYWALTLAVSP